MVKKNTIVQYKGGGYDGCFWEWNYAYYDHDGLFHNLVSSGRNGCSTEEELEEYIHRVDSGNSYYEYDLYCLDDEKELNRFGKETPISHLIHVANAINNINEDCDIKVACDRCEKIVPVVSAVGVGPHGIGGIAMEYGDIVCEECIDNNDLDE